MRIPSSQGGKSLLEIGRDHLRLCIGLASQSYDLNSPIADAVPNLDGTDLRRANISADEASHLLYAPVEASIGGRGTGFYVEYVFNFSIFFATIRDDLPGPVRSLAGSGAATALQAMILTALEAEDSSFILGTGGDVLDYLGEFLGNVVYQLQLRAFRILVLVRRSRGSESVLDRLIDLSVAAAMWGEAERLLPLGRERCAGDPEKTELLESAERMLRLATADGVRLIAAPPAPVRLPDADVQSLRVILTGCSLCQIYPKRRRAYERDGLFLEMIELPHSNQRNRPS